ncbi:hypothetical protein [Phyllobacterium sophorae]|nr:hypothetical protein [Phyllobacterium sophorae]
MRAARAAIDDIAGANEAHVTIVDAGDQADNVNPVLPASMPGHPARRGAK